MEHGASPSTENTPPSPISDHEKELRESLTARQTEEMREQWRRSEAELRRLQGREPLVTPPPKSPEKLPGPDIATGQHWIINGVEREILSVDREKGVAVLSLSRNEEKTRQEQIRQSGKPALPTAKALSLEDLKKHGRLA